MLIGWQVAIFGEAWGGHGVWAGGAAGPRSCSQSTGCWRPGSGRHTALWLLRIAWEKQDSLGAVAIVTDDWCSHGLTCGSKGEKKPWEGRLSGTDPFSQPSRLWAHVPQRLSQVTKMHQNPVFIQGFRAISPPVVSLRS